MKPLYIYRVEITGYKLSEYRKDKQWETVRRFARWTRFVLHHSPQEASKLVRKDYKQNWGGYNITNVEITQEESKPRLLEADWKPLEGEAG